MHRSCRQCSAGFDIPAFQEDFLRKIAPLAAGERFVVPPPSLCPDCRAQRRLSFRNDFALYFRSSDLSGKRVLSIYSPDKPYRVYGYDEWWSDGWDPLSYGVDFDFSKPFSEQFALLQRAVPRLNLYVDNFCEGCEYSNQLTMSRNCYLVFSGSSNEDCFYSYRLNNSRDCCDCLYCIQSELCHQCIDCVGCYNCRFCQNTMNSSDGIFLVDCQNCSSCAFCIGLRNQSCCLFNKPCSKQEYEEALQRYRFGSRALAAEYERRFRRFIAPYPRKFAAVKQVENTAGDNIQNAKNCFWVFDGANLEDVYFAQFVQDCKDCMDVNYCCDNTVLHYETATSGIDAYNVAFSMDTWPTVSNLLYCDSCSNGTRDCFGCIGLRRKRWCVLNKQYGESDYERLVSRIIRHMERTGEWGEFLPAAISPFSYNETTACEYFPVERDAALDWGWRWKDDEERERASAEAEVPDDSGDFWPEMTALPFACRTCARNFRITSREAALYTRMDVPAPDQCFLCRHRARMAKRNPRRLWPRSCAACGAAIYSSYSPERPERILCEECYAGQAA